MADRTVHCEGVFWTTPEVLFRAFTDERYLPWWFAPELDAGTRVDTLDLNVGGKFHFVFNFLDGSSAEVEGAYREIDGPRRLVFTWLPRDPDPLGGIETVVTVEFEPVEKKTKIALSHEGAPDDAAVALLAQSWKTVFERLDAAVERRALQDPPVGES